MVIIYHKFSRRKTWRLPKNIPARSEHKREKQRKQNHRPKPVSAASTALTPEQCRKDTWQRRPPVSELASLAKDLFRSGQNGERDERSAFVQVQ